MNTCDSCEVELTEENTHPILLGRSKEPYKFCGHCIKAIKASVQIEERQKEDA